MVSPPPEPSPVKGEGECWLMDVAPYLALSTLPPGEGGVRDR